ncbi:signal transduction histidine kinase [Burkholderiales bacterium JOSHI_001]|nr:signal transduction histidine kinase [Burkholderiales bacterium JOSHI_001]
MSANPTHRLPTGFGLTGIVLLVTLLAVAFVQARQYALLNHTVRYQNDYLVLSLYQLEVEYLRMRDQWQNADLSLEEPRKALQLRYDIFVSRVGLLQSDRAPALLGDTQEFARTLRRLESFIQRADLYLGATPKAQMSPQAAQALREDMLALEAPIHGMLVDASHVVAEQVTERSELVRQHNQVGIGLTACLSLLLLVFAFIAMRQMKLLELRRQSLEAAAERLGEARLEAEAANRAKSTFLANMSHEIRTPFHGLLGMLALLRDSRLDNRQQDFLRTATESADHLLAILDDILDLSKLESGSLTLMPAPHPLRALLAEVESLMRPQAQAKGLALRLDTDPKLPEHATLDATRVRQVLFNLLSNAIKFSDSGSVSLHVRNTETIPGGEPVLEFEVADTGVGMDEFTMARLFQRFSQGHQRPTHPQGGSGLGLEISRNLARLMGGDLIARSTPGVGSVFTFRMPLRIDRAPQPQPPLVDAASIGPLQVLVAEDHPINRKYLAALLERMGHPSRFVENGLEAYQALQEHRFDLVLMDVHMPVMDGIEATEHIRALPAPASATRIVALTADVFADTRERCLRAGMDEVITKPVSLESLKALLVRHGRGAARPANASAADGASRSPAPEAQDDSTPVDAPLLDRRVTHDVLEVMSSAEAAQLYDSFFTQAEDAARRMREAMRNADTEGLKRAAHGVKGAALNLGMAALADLAQRLHNSATDLAAPHLALGVQRFEEAVVATRAVCEAEGLLAHA